MQVSLLGPLAVIVGDRPVPVRAAKERAVMAALALRSGRVVRAEDLIGAVWGDDPPRSAHKALQTYVSALRRVLPDEIIETVPGGYRLRLPAEQVDPGGG